MQVGIVIHSSEGSSWTQIMEAANSSETSVTTHVSTWHHILEDFNLQQRYIKNNFKNYFPF